MEPDLSLHGANGYNPPAATLCAMFDHAVAAAPDSVALRHLDVVLTYRDLYQILLIRTYKPIHGDRST